MLVYKKISQVFEQLYTVILVKMFYGNMGRYEVLKLSCLHLELQSNLKCCKLKGHSQAVPSSFIANFKSQMGRTKWQAES